MRIHDCELWFVSPGCQIGEFVLTMPDIKIPKRGKIYSFNVSARLNLISETVS
jgi:fructose-1,6-bisphosphatase